TRACRRLSLNRIDNDCVRLSGFYVYLFMSFAYTYHNTRMYRISMNCDEKSSELYRHIYLCDSTIINRCTCLCYRHSVRFGDVCDVSSVTLPWNSGSPLNGDSAILFTLYSTRWGH